MNCRNTVFDARAQSAVAHFPRLRAMGVRRFRVEFAWESAAEAARVIETYRALLEGRRSPSAVLRDVGAIERFGVTSGTLATIRG